MPGPRHFLLFAISVTIAAFTGLSCGGGGPTSVSQELSTAGGSVILDDGASIYIPPGAISEAASVTISRGSDENPPPEELEAADALGEPFRIEIEGQDELARPVTVEVPYDPDKLPDGAAETTIFLAYFDPELDDWVPVGGEIDTKRQVIAVQTDHLSWWNVFTWNWDAWIAVLNNVLTLNVTDFLDAVALLTDDCPQSGENVAVDASEANNVVQGCIERDDPQKPELRIVNPKSFFFEVQPVSGGSGYPPQQILGPGESLRFEADTSDVSPLVIAAEINQRSGLFLITHLIIQMLPGLNQVGIQGTQISCITERISDVAPFAAAAESLLVERDGLAAAEDLTRFLLDTEAVDRFISAADGCLYRPAGTWTPEGIRQIGAATATIMSATDFVANYFLNYRSEIAFAWSAPPTRTATPIPLPPMADDLLQEATSFAMASCRQDFLDAGFYDSGGGLLEGTHVFALAEERAVQLREFTVDRARESDVTAADRANGIEWSGIIEVQWISRIQHRDGSWPNWSDDGITLDVDKLADGTWIHRSFVFSVADLKEEPCVRALPFLVLN